MIGRIGALSTRLASGASEVRNAQRLRYKIFYQEMSARQSIYNRLTRRDRDPHDAHCDHLLVLDDTKPAKPEVVGTQRFFLKSACSTDVEFHSQSEFDLEGLAARHSGKKFMELGRSCILPQYRTKRTAELMWHGTWAYALERKVDVMVGCASFGTSEVAKIAPALGFLFGQSTASGEWQVGTNGANAVALSDYKDNVADAKKAIRLLPPLLRGYLRLGAMFSTHAVPDPEFGTIDVLVVLPVDRINPRYISHYGADAGRHRK